MKIALAIIGLIILGFAAYVRLAPSDPARWHRARDWARDWTEDRDLAGGAFRVITGDAADLARLDEIARATPRTRVLAGSAAEGMITYITRTAGWGFPDYTTLTLKDGQISLFARLRFGKSDFGVNRQRLEAWIAALKR